MIKDKLGFGPKIATRSPRKRDIGKNIKQTYILTISSKKDIQSLVMLLENKK